MVDCFDCLRHDTVVCSNDENRDIGDVCTSRTHCRESFVTGGVKERDIMVGSVDAVCTDVLCYAACFAFCDVCMTDCVEK